MTDPTVEAGKRLLGMLHEVLQIPAPTPLGDAFREIGDLLDYAPATEGALLPHGMMVRFIVGTEAGVRKIAEDLNIPVEQEQDVFRTKVHTRCTVDVAGVNVSFFHIGPAPTTLRRPVDQTGTLEAQADAA